VAADSSARTARQRRPQAALQKLTKSWLIANAIGMIVYLFLASSLWVHPGEQGLPGGPGDAIYWFVALVPIVALFAIVNLAALTKVLIEFRRRNSRIPILLWSLVFSLWLNVLAYDYIKSFRYFDSNTSKVEKE
jgi:hypothetical protein